MFMFDIPELRHALRRDLHALLDRFAHSSFDELLLITREKPAYAKVGAEDRTEIEHVDAFTVELSRELDMMLSRDGLVSSQSGWFHAVEIDEHDEHSGWRLTRFNPMTARYADNHGGDPTTELVTDAERAEPEAVEVFAASEAKEHA